MALGYVFPGVGGWTLEVDQNGQRWRTDAEPADDISLVEQVESHGGDADTLAIGVSNTGDLTGDDGAGLASRRPVVMVARST